MAAYLSHDAMFENLPNTFYLCRHADTGVLVITVSNKMQQNNLELVYLRRQYGLVAQKILGKD